MDASDEATLLSLEQLLLDPVHRGSPAALAELLEADFVEFGSSGRTYMREETLEAIARSAPPAVAITRFRVRPLGEHQALVTYVAEGPRRSLRSSVWVRVGSRWRLVFHQGTPFAGG